MALLNRRHSAARIMQTTSRILSCAALLALAMVFPAQGQDANSDPKPETTKPETARQEIKPEIIESIAVGSVTYTNAEVLNRTRTDLFIRYAGGSVNIKIRDLDKSTQLQLGYSLADPATNAPQSGAGLPDIEIDPRYEELAEQIVWETKEYLNSLGPQAVYAAGGCVLLLYLFFCWCCALICQKARYKNTALVWFPLLKQIPLLRAADMNPWWILANLFPPVFAIVYIVWAFKIAKARGRGVLTGFLLLLPVLNVFAFLYLAFSDPLPEAEQPRGGKILTYQKQPRRAA